MYGIIIGVRVGPGREEVVRKMLENMIVPNARTLKGPTTGYWLRSLDRHVLRAVQLYDTKTNAQETADQIRSGGHLLVHRLVWYQ
jgi:hypothetical protein